MARTAALQLFQRSTQSIHGNTSNELITTQQVQIVRTAIQIILSIITSKS